MNNILSNFRRIFLTIVLMLLGNEPAMKELLHHNEQDVIILEKLFWKIEPYTSFDRKGF